MFNLIGNRSLFIYKYKIKVTINSIFLYTNMKYFLVIILATGILTINLPITIRPLENCVNRILDNTVEKNDTVYLINSNFKNVRHPKIYINTDYHFITFIKSSKPNIYVISINITNVLEVISQRKLLINKNKFIFIVNKVEKLLLNELNKHFINKVVFIITKSDKNVTEMNNVNNNFKLIFLEKCHNLKDIVNIFNHTLVPRRREFKLLYTISNPYVINKNDGILIELINLILSNMNIKFNSTNSNLSNSSVAFPSAFKTREYDIYTGMFPFRLVDNVFFESTDPVLTDECVFVAPNIIKNNFWKIFYMEFGIEVWGYFFLLLIIIYCLFYLIVYLLKERSFSILGLLLVVIFEGTTSVSIRRISFKTLLANYLLFCLLFTTVYKSKMYDIMKSKLFYELLQTMDDIVIYKCPVGVPSKKFVEEYKTGLPFEVNLFRNNLLHVCDDYQICIDRTLRQKDFVTSTMGRIAQSDIPKYFVHENRNSLLHIIRNKGVARVIYISIFFLKGHPLFEKFNNKLNIAAESGLVKQITQKYSREYKKIIESEKYQIPTVCSLNFNVFKSTFVIYFILIFFSVTVFCLELLRIL